MHFRVAKLSRGYSPIQFNVQIIGPAEAVPLLQSPVPDIFQQAVPSCRI